MTGKTSEKYNMTIDFWQESPQSREASPKILRGRLTMKPNPSAVNHEPLKVTLPSGQFALQVELFLGSALKIGSDDLEGI